jgi:hypothetical protein
MEQNTPAPIGSNRKAIFIVIGVLILALAVLTALKKSSWNSFRFPGGSLSMNDAVVPMSSVSSMKGAGVITERNSGEVVATDKTDFETIDKKIIKNGDLDLKVSSVDDASQKISVIAKSNGGEVASSSFYQTSNNLKSGNIVVKIPIANFEKTFAELKKVATLVISESTSGQDVTEQYADLQAQLKNKQAEERQFQNVMGQAQKISDILEVTQQLSRVRGEIERLQGRIKFMDSQTDMSSIFISLTEDANITFSDSWRPWQVVKETFNALVKDVQKFVNFLIVLIIQVIPVLALYLLIFYIIYRIGKKIYLKVKNRS